MHSWRRKRRAERPGPRPIATHAGQAGPPKSASTSRSESGASGATRPPFPVTPCEATGTDWTAELWPGRVTSSPSMARRRRPPQAFLVYLVEVLTRASRGYRGEGYQAHSSPALFSGPECESAWNKGPPFRGDRHPIGALTQSWCNWGSRGAVWPSVWPLDHGDVIAALTAA
jgi:hypothetical protein